MINNNGIIRLFERLFIDDFHYLNFTETLIETSFLNKLFISFSLSACTDWCVSKWHGLKKNQIKVFFSLFFPKNVLLIGSVSLSRCAESSLIHLILRLLSHLRVFNCESCHILLCGAVRRIWGEGRYTSHIHYLGISFTEG